MPESPKESTKHHTASVVLESCSGEQQLSHRVEPVCTHKAFLFGCHLPTAWCEQDQWRILETCFGQGLNFLVTWSAWRADPLRPKLLHFVAIKTNSAALEPLAHEAARCADLQPLALQLHAQLWGLLPGFHRLTFEDGHVLLTLCIGEVKTMLLQQQFEADCVYLSDLSVAQDSGAWDAHTTKAIARCCKRGARLACQANAHAIHAALGRCGFVFSTNEAPHTQPNNRLIQGRYHPSWEPKKSIQKLCFFDSVSANKLPRTAIVVGAGLAGAAVANSLARRGWRVVVLDAAGTPAGGASGLPAGLFAPHVSPDDSVLSQLSRSGIRMTLQQAHALLTLGVDWDNSGVLTCDADGADGKPPLTCAGAAGADWSLAATPSQLTRAGSVGAGAGTWHMRAGWIKPACLVNAWLAKPGIVWRGNAGVATLQPIAQGWRAVDAAGAVLEQASLVVLAAAYGSQALAASVNPAAPMALQAVRGQVSYDMYKTPHEQVSGLKSLPAFPVNGHGGLLPAVPFLGGLMWLMGATYERDCNVPTITQKDHEKNLARLQRLLPQVANELASTFNTGALQAWAGIRCATPGRLPTQGCLASADSGASVWFCTGMGSRGLTFAFLCAELLAAQLHGEPLPVDRRLARALTNSQLTTLRF